MNAKGMSLCASALQGSQRGVRIGSLLHELALSRGKRIRFDSPLVNNTQDIDLEIIKNKKYLKRSEYIHSELVSKLNRC